MANTEEIAFVLYLIKGNEVEYQRRHDEIWPELSAAIKKAGILDYQIFLEPRTGHLFAYQKRRTDHTVDLLPGLPIMRKWWDYMADIMEVNADNSPVVQPLERVFRFLAD
ncbi:MAG: L-rhamnose mutarotase [Haliscomenobacter sp.]|uniref:L-rhamnose mutarotase n=1 Tax=Haliscomenobacter sp. TaxID=2717303 RepID=UPI0029A84618|nr:L-rhamnose mutarotase [Haliscomenobacter sp.]MDX2067259.1 L-rhamnose mutarotase [Haliscomenobacter sp.]